jgi:membrane protein
MTTDGPFDTPGPPASEPGQLPRDARAGMQAHDRPVIGRRVRRGIEVSKEKYSGSAAEYLWGRLASVDFINRGVLFAATLLLFFFPFLIVVNALAGRSATTGLARHLGLSKQAAADVGHLFTSSAATSSAVTGTAWVFFILGGIAAAAAVQELYERVFDLDRRGAKNMVRGLIWLAVLVGCAWLGGLAGPGLRSAGGPVLLAVTGLVVFTGFWWFTMWFLLAGRISWRLLFPSAVATAVFWLGMELVFSVAFSGMVISNNHKYGPIGVVFALMSWLIAIGVVIILGAVTGVVREERRASSQTALGRPRRDR